MAVGVLKTPGGNMGRAKAPGRKSLFYKGNLESGGS